MSKKLNKRQQRELQELEQLKAAQREVEASKADSDEEEGEDDEPGGGPVNAFAALGPEDGAEPEESEEEEEVAPAAAPKKSKKKKSKKKKSATATPKVEDEDDSAASPAASGPAKVGKGKKKGGGGTVQPAGDEEMDEVDKALAELKLKYGEDSAGTTAGASGAASTSASAMVYRQLLSVDPKNLDADAELRRFFGSKVIAGDKPSSRRVARGYTLSKPKANYPPPTSLAGLGMREMTDEEVAEVYERRLLDMTKSGEKWFTFEHAGVWREITKQFLGAVRSHDPNELMALLQVYPWHVDTLLQMSEVYRLQSDIGAASDYAERALYAFDRCLAPSFNVPSGACRLDFDRVENRPMFTALHRIISYLGRRGCWNTAFNFAKLLFALDPMGDPHGAAFWLDFLAVKSGNPGWIISMMDESSSWEPASLFKGYPGMAYALALARRAQETADKSSDHSKSDEDLREAMTTFPQVIIPLADKIGATVPAAARSEPLLAVQAGHSDDQTNVLHLLAHIYVSRSEALWKEASNLAWFESQLSPALSQLRDPVAFQNREDALSMWDFARDPMDESETMNVPLFVCRHVVCSESTAFVGFLPQAIRNAAVHAFDPLPPSTAISAYNGDYFAGVKISGRGVRGAGGAGGGGVGARDMAEGFMERLMDAVQTHPPDWQDRVRNALRDMLGQRAYAAIPEEHRQEMIQQFIDVAGGAMGEAGEGGEARMPGGFPGAGQDEQ